MQDSKRARLCLCGCGGTFAPVTPWQRFISSKHRDGYWIVVRQEAQKLAQRKLAKHLHETKAST